MLYWRVLNCILYENVLFQSQGTFEYQWTFPPSYSIKPAESQILACGRHRISTQTQQPGSSTPGYTACQTMLMLRLEWNPYLEATITQENVSTLDEKSTGQVPGSVPFWLSHRVLYLSDFIECASTHLTGVLRGTSKKIQNVFEKYKMINIFC